MNSYYIISPITAFILSFLIIPALRKIAIPIGLVDKPNYRKIHSNPVPLVGGIAIFFATILALTLVVPFNSELLAYKNTFFGVVILLIVGVIDDRFDLRASLKLAIQLLLAHFIFSQGIKIESLNGFFGVYALPDWIQYFLTIIIITGVVNAFNLMDGIDGLAAGMAIVGFAIFTVLATVNGQHYAAIIFLTSIGALLAFLRYNLSHKKKIFMGDAGSLIIGFVMVVSGLHLIQNAQDSIHLSTITLGVISVLFVPVFDAFRVFRRRLKAGKSPFQADKTHLHHLILITGLKHKMASFFIVSMMTLISIIGYLSFQFAGLTISIAMMLFVFIIITTILQFNEKLNYWKNFIRQMENGTKE